MLTPLDAPLDRLPELMIDSFNFARDVSRLQRSRVSLTSTKIARIQNMRSMLGGLIEDAMPEVELVQDYLPLGKVHFRIRETGEEYVVKSDRMREREMKSKVDDVPIIGLETLDADRQYVTVIFYRFELDHLELRSARTEAIRENGAWEYYLLEPAGIIGRFSYADSISADGFEQADDDLFDDLDWDLDEDTGTE